ncbi:unnamed protein product [Aureobasidium pullulans]|nr:unnamed protein product [Aureobasidium pullulans]
MSPHFPRRSRRIKENREQSRVPRIYLTADERSALNYKFCKHVIQTLLNSTDEHIVPFQKPVDAEAENVPDYHSIIKRPMDLSTMLHKLRNDEYPSPQEPRKDFLLITNNCFRYNRPDSDVYLKGVKFQAAYKRMWYDGGRWIQEQAARLYSLDNAVQVDNMYIGSIGYSSDTSEEEADEDLESPHRSYKDDNHKAQESSDEDDSVTSSSSSERPDEEYLADDLDLDNIEHPRSSSHKRTFEIITEPQSQALTPTKPDQIPDLDAKPPLKNPASNLLQKPHLFHPTTHQSSSKQPSTKSSKSKSKQSSPASTPTPPTNSAPTTTLQTSSGPTTKANNSRKSGDRKLWKS